jgi:hypothetical protein
MGVIQPLTDFKWETVEPKIIYKFSPKYFLTMGMSFFTAVNTAKCTQAYKIQPSITLPI